MHEYIPRVRMTKKENKEIEIHKPTRGLKLFVVTKVARARKFSLHSWLIKATFPGRVSEKGLINYSLSLSLSLRKTRSCIGMHHRRDALCAHLFSRAPSHASASGRLDKEIPDPRVLSRTRIPEERANNLIITKTCSCSLTAKYVFSCNE